MLTSIIKQVYASDTQSVANVEIEYSNGKETKEITYRVSDPDSITQISRNQIAEFERIDKINELIKNPPLGEINTTVSIVEKTEEQLFEEKRNDLIRKKKDLELGLISQKEYDKLLIEVKK